MPTLANYVKTDWVDEEVQPTGTPDIDAGNLGKIENGIYDVTEAVQVLQDVTGPTDTQILNQVKNVDGSGSGLDADLFRGAAPSAFLSSSSTLPTIVLPPETIPNAQIVASQAAMLALTAQKGDWALRTDANPDRYYMLNGTDPTILGNWQRMDSNEFATINSLSPTSGNLVLGPADLSPAALAASTRNAASGVAGLNASTLVDTQYLGTGTANSSRYLKGDGTWGTAPHICTSSTRPSSPPEGLMIYETDTDKAYINVGTSGTPIWRFVGTVYVIPFSDGRTTLTTGDIPLAFRVPFDMTIIGVYGTLYTPSSSGSFIFDLKRATAAAPATRTSIYTTTGNRPTITATNYLSTLLLPDTVDIPGNDFLIANLNSVGTGAAGALLHVLYVGRG